MTNINTLTNHPPKDILLAVDKPATYCIRVVGELDKSWSNRLGGMKISVSGQEGKQEVSTLSGAMERAGLDPGPLRAR